MVRLLAGPFVLTYTETGTPANMNIQTWWPGVGLIVDGRLDITRPDGRVDSTLATCIATLDGVCGIFGRWGGGDSYGWWPAHQKLVSISGSGREYVREPYTFMYQQTHPDDQIGHGHSSMALFSYVKLQDRRVYFSNGRMYRQVNGVEPDVPESDVFPSLVWSTFIRGHICAGRNLAEVFVGDDVMDQACFYNTTHQKVSSPVYHLGFNCRAIVYAPEYGVMISDHYESVTPPPDPANPTKPWDVIRVWSLEVEPTLMTPVATTGALKSGQVITYYVQVTGTQTDPAEGELVEWVLTGAGVLLDLQTITDVQGYATTRVQYRLGESGSSVVTASVAC